MKRKVKKMIYFISVLMFAFVLTNCGLRGARKDQSIIVNLGIRPTTLDPSFNTTTTGSDVLRTMFEGLYTEDGMPGAAESYTQSDDGLTYTFRIRPTARWSDGKLVTADDFVYSFMRTLNPENKSELAGLLYYVKGALQYNKNLIPPEDVGIKALDPQTLEIQLEYQVPFIMQILGQSAAYPLRRDIVEKHPDDWTTDPQTFIGNGPFKVKTIDFEKGIKLVPNDKYWASSKVKLKNVEMLFIEDSETAYDSFQKGDIDFLNNVPLDKMKELEEKGFIIKRPTLTVSYLTFNLSGNGLSPEVKAFIENKKVRKALSLALDRSGILNDNLRIDRQAATSFVPPGIHMADMLKFKFKDYYPASGNIKEAQQLMKEAGYDDFAKIPKIKLNYLYKPYKVELYKEIIDTWKNALGVEVVLNPISSEELYKSLSSTNYEISESGWTADYNAPSAFLGLLRSGNKKNDPNYNNPEYDKLLDEALKETNIQARTELYHNAEDILMDDMPIVPLAYTTNIIAVIPRLRDWTISEKDELSFKYAYLAADKK